MLGVVLTIPLIVLAFGRSGESDSMDGATTAPASPGAGSAVTPTEPAASSQEAAVRLRQALGSAVSAGRFPALQPPVADLGIQAWARGVAREGCVNVAVRDIEKCSSGPVDSTDRVLVLGDTTATAYVPAIRAALGERFRIQQLTLQECPDWDAPVKRLNGSAFPECDTYRAQTWKEVRRIRPDVLVLATSWLAGSHLGSDATGGAAADEVTAGYERSLAALVPSARLTVVLASPPGGSALQDCAKPQATPSDCTAVVSPAYTAITAAERVITERAGAVYVDTLGWFCAAQSCPAFVDRTPIYADGVHITQEYADRLGDVMRDALVGAANLVKAREGATS